MSTWALNQALPLPINSTSGDATLTAGVQNNFLTSSPNFVQPLSMNVYPWALCTVAVLMGATAPSALSFLLGISGVGNFFTYTVAPALLVNNATILISFMGVGVSSRSTFAGAGTSLTLGGLSVTQNCTVKGVGTSAIFGLAIGPDV